MMTSFLSVDQVLTTIAPDIPSDQVEDYALTMVYANAAARAARDGGAPAAKDAQAFQSRWVQVLGKVGWVISSAGRGSTSSSSGEGISLAEQLVQTGGPAFEDTVSALQARLNKAPKDKLIRNWWKASTGPDFLQGAIGTLSQSDGAPALSILSFTVDLSKLEAPGSGWFGRDTPFDATGADSLFVKLDPKSIEMPVSSLQATLNLQQFDSQRDAIREALGSKFSDHYAAEPQMAF